MPLHEPTCRPWWRKIDLAAVRHETAMQQDAQELLYYRFLMAYTEHRCQLPADPVVLARVLQTTAPKARKFLEACSGFITVGNDGNLVHEMSQRDFEAAVKQSKRQSDNRKGRLKVVTNG